MEFLQISSKSQTKKIKKRKSINDMANIWKMIEEEELDDKIKCVYKKEDVTHTKKCDECNNDLYNDEHGFLFCGNNSCGKLFKDVLDFRCSCFH